MCWIIQSSLDHLAGAGAAGQACGCPLYWKGPLFYGAGGERTGSVSVHKFIAMWRKVLQNCHDDAAKFVHLLMSPGSNHLVQEDFLPLLQDIVNTHPGLSFLKEASEFHSRYITTVIQRIFYTVNRSWSGRITCTELRKSTFLQNVSLLEEEADINQLTEFFSYEHFYVIYCKFWEIDTDHDLLIDADDLARHNDHGRITLQDLKRCKMAGVFFDTFFNVEKYLDREQKEQVSLLRDGEGDGAEGSDWERYAAEEYDLLVAEEAAGDPWNDGYEPALSPVDPKLRPQLDVRPFLEAPAALGAVDLYEYEAEDSPQLL
ncbi:serine/threonine-protein phosphatase 2A regulatory subunit B'' subunit beta [Echinops telfairi]|uniref:Serine/threonine-protein phosphatase 2A regulatory subunit B'' subunit beta n=1 Tax=Echinops telfairi TaxID=9371 RepID=A0AC55D4U0_ECHTE|nr:serine/threonine-protein phosphatase 2A regulatory subunit B'' subunit beta [Echinops telfairi]